MTFLTSLFFKFILQGYSVGLRTLFCSALQSYGRFWNLGVWRILLWHVLSGGHYWWRRWHRFEHCQSSKREEAGLAMQYGTAAVSTSLREQCAGPMRRQRAGQRRNEIGRAQRLHTRSFVSNGWACDLEFWKHHWWAEALYRPPWTKTTHRFSLTDLLHTIFL